MISGSGLEKLNLYSIQNEINAEHENQCQTTLFILSWINIISIRFTCWMTSIHSWEIRSFHRHSSVASAKNVGSHSSALLTLSCMVTSSVSVSECITTKNRLSPTCIVQSRYEENRATVSLALPPDHFWNYPNSKYCSHAACVVYCALKTAAAPVSANIHSHATTSLSINICSDNGREMVCRVLSRLFYSIFGCCCCTALCTAWQRILYILRFSISYGNWIHGKRGWLCCNQQYLENAMNVRSLCWTQL